MRQSREVAEETRRRIVRTAAEQFRRHGVGGIGIADVMKEAGLTHGGFYKHFASKDDLAAEACAWALSSGYDELDAIAAKAPPGRRLEAFVKAYLSMEHRDRPEGGCALAALGAEAARLDGKARDELAAGYRRLADHMAGMLTGLPAADARRKGAAIVSAMVGALTIARLTADRAAAEEVLRSARRFILGSLPPAS